jgi:hypothetical protein
MKAYDCLSSCINPQREDNTGVKLSRADFAINLIASGSPDLTPAVKRCSTLLAAGFSMD